ncbi:hypothetical protein IF1G_00898 [Cordyceps javanica]|uniref:Uncharacterized protein n=1 Tax=Cordyceps javanica TaxID=43265 RepID=A0A545VGX2_9HYPO|nr:hypothetical protein IF1G_00898 [Cordyceps javanica]
MHQPHRSQEMATQGVMSGHGTRWPTYKKLRDGKWLANRITVCSYWVKLWRFLDWVVESNRSSTSAVLPYVGSDARVTTAGWLWRWLSVALIGPG